MMGGMGGMLGGCLSGMGSMGAFMGAFWLAIIAALLYVVRRAGQARPLAPARVASGTPGDAALATLRDRFARGELDRDEYEERRRILASDDARWP